MLPKATTTTVPWSTPDSQDMQEPASAESLSVPTQPKRIKRKRKDLEQSETSLKMPCCSESFRQLVNQIEKAESTDSAFPVTQTDTRPIGSFSTVSLLPDDAVLKESGKLKESETDQETELADFQVKVQERILNPEHDKQWMEDCQCFEAIKQMQVRPGCELSPKKLTLPAKTLHKKLLIFDLDNTLVHCTPAIEGSHHSIQVNLPTGKQVSAGIYIRPYARECLQLASELFEVAVFTASHQCYSDQVIDLLDPQHLWVHHRLFREECVVLGDRYLIKDLRVISNYELKDVAIVENSLLSYGLQLYNGVLVPSWTGDSGDTNLKTLMKYFKPLAMCEDVRMLNQQVFEPYYRCLGSTD